MKKFIIAYYSLFDGELTMTPWTSYTDVDALNEFLQAKGWDLSEAELFTVEDCEIFAINCDSNIKIMEI